MKDKARPLFIDFEASSLGPTSYPIEVGFSDPAGGEPISVLINPYAIEDWTDWDLHAQHEIHGISRQQLRAEGRHPIEVVEILNQLLQGRDIFCDGGDFDRFWCQRLFEAANRTPQFRIRDAELLWHQGWNRRRSSLQGIGDRLIEPGADKEEWLYDLKQRAWQITPGPKHRAANDVAYLEQLYQLIIEETRA